MTESKAEIVRRLDDHAGDYFRVILGSNSRRRGLVLRAFADNPGAALRHLNKGDEANKLTAKGSADVLDEVLGVISDPEKARVLLHEWLDADRLRDLIQARGDLPSVVSEIAPLEDILSAILNDIRGDVAKIEQNNALVTGKRSSRMVIREQVAVAEDHDFDDDDDETPQEELFELADGPIPLLAFYMWSLKIQDRADYGQFLDMRVGRYNVRELLTLAVWEMAECPENLNRIMAEEFVRVGLDYEESLILLGELLGRDDIRRFDADELEEARRVLAKRRSSLEKAPQMLTPADAKKKAEDIGNKLGL